MSKLCSGRELRDIILAGNGAFVLFYAAWCPFSRAFLPIYERHAKGRDIDFVRVPLDGNEDVFEENAVDVYPTVMFFKKGAVVKRLDGKYLAGIREKHFADFIDSCVSGGA